MADTTHSYYDWQVSTLMLAYDVTDPIARDDTTRLNERQQNVEHELHEMVHQLLPPDYIRDPAKEFPPDLVMQMTRATLRRAAEIAGLAGS